MLKWNSKSYIFTKEESLRIFFPLKDHACARSQYLKEAFPFATWLRNRRILGKRKSERVGVLSGTVYPSKWKNVPDVKKKIKHEYWNHEFGISFAKNQNWFLYHDGLCLSSNLVVFHSLTLWVHTFFLIYTYRGEGRRILN